MVEIIQPGGGGGGGGTPGGSNTQVQYNNAGSFGGITGLTTNGNTITYAPTARTSGSTSYLSITTPADIGITANTASVGINLAAGTRTWADGTVANQREVLLNAPTYNKTTAATTFTRASTFSISGAPIAAAGVTITNSYAIDIPGISHFGSQLGGTTQQGVNGTGLDIADSCNTTGGQTVNNSNTATSPNAASAFSGYVLYNDLANGSTYTHYAGMFYNSNSYNDASFGTAVNVVNQLALSATDGPISFQTFITGSPAYINMIIGGSATTNEIARWTTTGMTIGLAGTLTGAIAFAGATSGSTTLTASATGTGTLTLPARTSTIATLAGDQTFTGRFTFTPLAISSGVTSYLTLNIPADTNMTASTESIGFSTVTAIRQWATGALTTQREWNIAAPTYAFVGASTITNASTVQIGGFPIAGTNATITGAHALSFGVAPKGSATSCLINLGNVNIASGSANGTYLGVNPASFSGDFLNFQVNGTMQIKISSAGLISIGTTATLGGNTLNFPNSGGTVTSGGTTGISGFQGGTAGAIVGVTNGGTASWTSAEGQLLAIGSGTSYTVSSGTGIFDATSVLNTINQTSTATGVTRGLYINPTLTGAYDHRAFEIPALTFNSISTTTLAQYQTAVIGITTITSGSSRTVTNAASLHITGAPTQAGSVTITNPYALQIDAGNVFLGAKVSTYNNIATVSNGIPSELATVDLTAQSAAKTATTIYTPAATGMFRIYVYLQVTTAGSTSSVLGGTNGVTITYNDGDGNVAQSDTVALATTTGTIAITSATNTTATNLEGSKTIYARTGVAIQYAIDYTSVGVTAMQYAAHLKVVAL